MTATRPLQAPGQLTACHASIEEYEEFVRGHTSSRGSANHYMRAYRQFVEAYPDLENWFRAPLSERVGRLYLAGRMEDQYTEMTSRVSYLARSYLTFLAIRGYASYDWEWLVAVPMLPVWKYFEYNDLAAAVQGLAEEAERLGYNVVSSRQGLRWAISRTFMHTIDPDVSHIGEREIDELLSTARTFGERHDVSTYYGSEKSYRSALKGYGTHLHMLRVVLYHRGQIATEPRKVWYVAYDRAPLKPAVEAVLRRYLLVRGLTARPNTRYKIESGLRAFALWLAKEYPEVKSFEQVNRDHLLEFAQMLATTPTEQTGRPMGPMTRRGKLSTLSVFFRDTADWGWVGVPGRPLLGVGDLPKVPDRVPRYIPEDELARLMEVIRALECPYQRAALLIARWSGARRDEIRRLELDCLDAYPDGTPRLRIPAGKTYQERVVPLNDEAADAIRVIQRLREGESVRGFRDEQTGAVKQYLFVHHGKIFDVHYLFHYPLRNACLEAGLVDAQGKPKITPHRFRHTVGTQLAERGARLHTIMKMLGHQSANMTMVYATISDREVLKDYRMVLGPGATIAGPLAETLRSGDLPAADVEWIKSNFWKTELELGHCLRLPQEGPCECDLYLSCTKFVTTKEYAPRLRARRRRELGLIEDAVSNGWEREVERHRCTIRRIDQLLLEMGEPVEDTGESG